MSKRYPEWEVEGRDWPNRTASSFVDTDRYRWHVQMMGPADPGVPVCLLIHGTGAATHSWRDIMPLLARKYRVVAMDLPGHGFTRSKGTHGVSLPEMTRSIGILLEQLGAEPALIVGHSAGTAIGMQLSLEHEWRAPIVGVNPALLPFPGLAAKLFPQLAKLLFTNPVVSLIFARMARFPGEVERFLRRSTGSRINRAGIQHYKLLFTRPGHCDGAIRMMASWRLEDLRERLPDVAVPVMLIHADRDRAIPRSAVQTAADLIPDCTLEEINGLGHLAHEEKPELVANMISAFAARSLG